MKQQRDTLKRYQQRVEKLLEKERELAKKLLSENKKEYDSLNFLICVYIYKFVYSHTCRLYNIACTLKSVLYFPTE